MTRVWKLILGVAAALALVVASAPRASANAVVTGTLTLADCGSAGTGCPAATYTFSISNNSATLTIHITGGVNSDNDELTSVNLGISGLSGVSVTGPNAGWTFALGPTNNSGCQGTSGAFICAQGSVMIADGGTYTWTWNYDALSDGDVNGLSGTGIHIGANYDPHDGFIVSQDGTAGGQTPEPSSLLLLGTGLVGLGAAFRRRLKA